MDPIADTKRLIESRKAVAAAEALIEQPAGPPRRVLSPILAGGKPGNSHVVPVGYGWGQTCIAACGRSTKDLGLDWVSSAMFKDGLPLVDCEGCKDAYREVPS